MFSRHPAERIRVDLSAGQGRRQGWSTQRRLPRADRSRRQSDVATEAAADLTPASTTHSVECAVGHRPAPAIAGADQTGGAPPGLARPRQRCPHTERRLLYMAAEHCGKEEDCSRTSRVRVGQPAPTSKCVMSRPHTCTTRTQPYIRGGAASSREG